MVYIVIELTIGENYCLPFEADCCTDIVEVFGFIKVVTVFQYGFHTHNGKTRYRGLLKHRMLAYSRCMWINLRRMVIFQISTFQRPTFAIFGPIREAFGSFKAISQKIFTRGVDCYVSLRMTTLVRLNSKYVPF